MPIHTVLKEIKILKKCQHICQLNIKNGSTPQEITGMLSVTNEQNSTVHLYSFLRHYSIHPVTFTMALQWRDVTI